MPWMVPFEKLDTDQRQAYDRIIAKKTGNDLITGYAGTGKTILLIHTMVGIKALHPNYSVCIVIFTHSLESLFKSGIPSEMSGTPVMTYFEFKKQQIFYNLVIVDEIQDIPLQAVESINRYSGRIIAACDYDQSIWKQRITREQLINVIEPEEHKLEILWRIAPTIQNIAKILQPESNIQMGRFNHNHDIEAALCQSDSRGDYIENKKHEYLWVWKNAIEISQRGNPVAILFRKHERSLLDFCKVICKKNNLNMPDMTRQWINGFLIPPYGKINSLFKINGISMPYLGNGFGRYEDAENKSLAFIMTYHSAKGLDFDTVFLPDLDQGNAICPGDEKMSRRLLFVAMTRCRRSLYISYSGDKPNSLLGDIPSGLLPISKI